MEIDDSSMGMEDVDNSPIERGTDPLGDNRQGRRKGSRQLVLSGILALAFTVLAIVDLTSGHTLRGLLAAVVAVLNVVILVKERASSRESVNETQGTRTPRTRTDHSESP